METILTRLQQSFANWRSSSSKKGYSNASLREQAVQCLSHYTYREVSETIGISDTTLRSWQKSLCSDQETADNPPAFIPMNFDCIQNTDGSNQAPLSLQINLSGGITIQVEPKSIASSIAFIVALNKESKLCSI